MDLETIWFCVIAFLFVGFFFLEGFDYGVGMLLPFLARNEAEKKSVLGSVMAFWEGNEVWLVALGATMFAVFPAWYAALFSSFYLIVFVILLSLIARGLGFKLRSVSKSVGARYFWEAMIFLGSFLSAFLWGIILGNLLRGLELNSNFEHTGSLKALLNPYALSCGALIVFLFILHGALFLSFRLEKVLLQRLMRIYSALYTISAGLAVIFFMLTFFETGGFKNDAARIAITLAFVIFVVSWTVSFRSARTAFLIESAALLLITTSFFIYLYPNLLLQSKQPGLSLNIYNASSSDYSLKVFLIIMSFILPVVLIYEGWIYWKFRFPEFPRGSDPQR